MMNSRIMKPELALYTFGYYGVMALESEQFTFEGKTIPITASIGAATWNATRSNEVPDLLARADAALLDAKRAGRNQVRGSDSGE